tara:strand:+ start:1139 stop:1609 length:471 start_codon:yes stop_codon:yes gene_type:complete
MKENELKVTDTSGAATELGYIFTFLLGVLLLSIFSVWTWEIETATRDRWNQQAIQLNLDDIASAIERADEASRLGNITYTESIWWRATEADENQLTLQLTDNYLILIDDSGSLDSEVFVSGTGNGQHNGTVELSGASLVWIVHQDGITSIQPVRPQ